MGARAAGSDPYYAFSLTNGSLFFAHLKNEDAKYLYLSDVHYLQRNPVPTNPKKGGPEIPPISLVKQSTDFHGPKDELVLNRGQLLFYQELRDDSKIVEGIQKQAEAAAAAASSGQKAPTTPQPAPPAQKSAP